MIDQELKDKIAQHFQKMNYNFILKVAIFGSNSINRKKLNKSAFTKIKIQEKESDIDLLLIAFNTDLFTKIAVKENLLTDLGIDIPVDMLFLTLEYYLKKKDAKSGLVPELILSEEVIYTKKIGQHDLSKKELKHE